MILESLNIHGFGCLKEKVKFAADRLNLIMADNEAGKSTLVSALIAAFYGIEYDYRKTPGGTIQTQKKLPGSLPHHKLALPWSEPAKFGLTLEFTQNDIQWKLVRDFDGKTVQLIDRKSRRDKSDKYHRGKGFYEIGEGLIGLPCENFLKSFYLKQEEANLIHQAGGLTPHVQKVASTLDGGVTSEAAIDRLQEALKKYPYPGSINGLKMVNALKRYNEELGTVSQQIDELNRQRNEIEPLSLKLTEIEKELTSLKETRNTHIELGNIAELFELEQLIEKQQRLIEEHIELSANVKELKEYSEFPAHRWEELNNISIRLEGMTSSIQKLRDERQTKIEAPLKEIENEFQEYGSLQDINEDELKEFEDAVSRFADRRKRFQEIRRERDSLDDNISEKGFDKERYNWLNQTFGEMGDNERNFIEDYRASYAEEEVSYSGAQARRESLEKQQEQASRLRMKKIGTSRIFLIIFAVMVMAGGGILHYLDNQIILGFGLIGAALLNLLIGIILRFGAGTIKSTGLDLIAQDLSAAVDLEIKAGGGLKEIYDDLERLAQNANLKDGNELLTEYTNFERMHRKAEPLAELERNMQRAAVEAEEALENITPFFRKVNQSLPDDDKVVDATRELLERYRSAVELGRQRDSLNERREQMNENLTNQIEELERNRKTVLEILKEGKIENTEPLDEAVKVFKTIRENHLKYRLISEIRLPRIEREMLSESDIAAKKERLSVLQAKGITVTDDNKPERSPEYYRELNENASRKIDLLNHDKADISRKIGLVLEKYQDQYPELHQRKLELKADVKRAEKFQSEIEISIEIMEEISREVYSSWADALSEETTPLLEALNPRYKEIKFDENLAFTIVDRKLDRTISSEDVEQVLSTGSADEIFLAARLGIASYLSHGAEGPLPIVLDEPLSSADDERFLSGMKFFIENLSKSNQVLILSCHEQRHKWLKKKLPDLFKERVNYITLSS